LFLSKLLLDNYASFTSLKLVLKTESKTNFSRPLQAVRNGFFFERLEITNVGCNLKEFDGLTWLTLPNVLRQIYATGGWCCSVSITHWWVRRWAEAASDWNRIRNPTLLHWSNN